MPKTEISQDLINNLINDITYLQDEAEALKYVIDAVPYDRKTPDGKSIVERLLFLDHAQQQYFRAILEDAFASPRPINLNAYAKPEESFKLDEEKASDVQKVLYKIAKHRAALLNLVEKISLVEWERSISKGNNVINLYNFADEMVKRERKILREIADLIMTYQKDAEQQREIRKGRPTGG